MKIDVQTYILILQNYTFVSFKMIISTTISYFDNENITNSLRVHENWHNNYGNWLKYFSLQCFVLLWLTISFYLVCNKNLTTILWSIHVNKRQSAILHIFVSYWFSLAHDLHVLSSVHAFHCSFWWQMKMIRREYKVLCKIL